MLTFLIILHVASAVIFVGPAMVASSAFPKQAEAARQGDAQAAGRAQLTHRNTSLYGILSALTPLLGAAALFAGWEYFKSSGQYHASLLLAVIAWAVLIGLVIPQQKKMLGTLKLLPASDADPEKDQVKDWDKSKKMTTIGAGIFNLLWIIILILMFVNNFSS